MEQTVKKTYRKVRKSLQELEERKRKVKNVRKERKEIKIFNYGDKQRSEKRTYEVSIERETMELNPQLTTPIQRIHVSRCSSEPLLNHLVIKKNIDSIYKRIENKRNLGNPSSNQMNSTLKPQGIEETEEAQESIVRVGIGYRVWFVDSKEEKEKGPYLKFDVGYCDQKEYSLKKRISTGIKRIVDVDQKNMGRTIKRKGKNARVKRINLITELEKIRAVSDYTGCGILHQPKRGKIKLKKKKVS